MCLFEYVMACVRCVCHLCDHVYDCVCAHVYMCQDVCVTVCVCVCDMIYCVHGRMCAMVCVSLLFRQKTGNIQKYVYICEHSVSVALHYYSVFFFLHHLLCRCDGWSAVHGGHIAHLCIFDPKEDCNDLYWSVLCSNRH